MLFNSLAFLLFLPIVFALYWSLRSLRWQNKIIIAASFFFYGWWDWRFLLLMIATCVANYYIGNAIFKLGVRSKELGVRSEELGVRSEELGVRSEELGVKSEELGVSKPPTSNLQPPTSKSVGFIDLTDFSPRHLRAEVGICLLPEYQSQRIGTEALRLVEEYAAQMLHIHQLYAYINPSNIISQRLFSSAGYQLAGMLRDWVKTPDGYESIEIRQKKIEKKV